MKNNLFCDDCIFCDVCSERGDPCEDYYNELAYDDNTEDERFEFYKEWFSYEELFYS